MTETMEDSGPRQAAGPAPSQAAPSDGELAARIARGDAEALAELYDRYAPRLFGLVGRLLADPHDREEVLQETFLTVWRKASGYDGRRGRLSSWLVAIAHHKAIDLLRRKRRRPGRPQDLAWPDLTADASGSPVFGPDEVSDQALAMDHRAAVEQALARLRPEERQVVVLAYFHGYTHREIAAFCSIPLGTVKSRMRSAVERLRGLLSEEDMEMRRP